MTQRIYTLLLYMLLAASLPAWSRDVFLGNDSESNVGKIVEIEVGAEPLTLYDGSTATSKPDTYNDFATGVCFRTDPGTKLTITFDEYDLKNVNVYLYDTKVDKISYYYDDWDEEYTYTTPSGWKTYFYSTKPPTEPFSTETGYLTVVWKPSGSTITGSGIKATVEMEVAGDMELKQATMFQATPKVFCGQTDAPLFGVDIVTARSLNPLTIDAFAYNCPWGDEVGDIRICREDASGNLEEVTPQGSVLATGSNKFYFVGNVARDAAGPFAAPEITSLSVGGNEVTLQGDTPADIAVTRELLMPGDGSWPTVTIDTPRSFYDTGGASGKVPLKSEGTITFLPADPSKKIQMDVTGFGIFIASIASNSDQFKVYSGRTTDAGNLLFQATSSGLPGKIKSTAADGALTVYYKCTAVSDFYAGTGWEATVSQFAEAPMTIEGVTAESAFDAGATVSENAAGVTAIYFNVVTDNALQPLSFSGATLSASTNVNGASLYYLGKNRDASAVKEANLITTVAFNTGQATLNADKVLTEGNNWFAVTADIAPGVADGEEIAITLASVNAGSGSFATATEAKATVSNSCVLTSGSHSHTISSRWSIANEPYAYNADRYNPSTTNHTVTFYPSDPDGKIELNISEFEIYYASQSYGTRAKFEVRSGGTSGAVLWSCASTTDAATGPGKPLVSTADDGSLTVIFNPNTSTTSYCKKGFRGEVRQVITKPMAIAGVEVLQNAPGVTGVMTGSTNNRLLDINVAAEGNTSPITVKGLEVALTGADAMKALHVRTSGNSRDFSTSVPAGSVTAPVADEVTVEFTTPVELADGDNRLWLTFDVADDIDSDIIIDAEARALVLSDGSRLAIEEGNPEGHSVTQNIYLMPSGEDNTVTVTRTLQFYDDGGADGNISMSFNGKVTFLPGKPGTAVYIDTPENGFALGWHSMKVYNGTEVSEETLIDSYMGLNGPAYIVSEAENGALTVTVKTKSSPSVAGFHCQVGLRTLEELSVASAPVAEGAASDYVVRGSTNTPLLKTRLDIDGDLGTLDLTSAKATMAINGGAITKASLFVTPSDVFNTSMPLGEGVADPSGEITITATDAATPAIDRKGTWYLWLAADIDAATPAGSVISATLTEVTLGDTDFAVTGDNTVELPVKAGLSGTYTVGKSGDYTSFNAVRQALADGVEGAVTFEILDGSYNENIFISDVKGTSESSPVTFRSQSGNRAAVVITGSMPTSSVDIYAEPNPEYISYHHEGMVQVQRTPYVTFRDMTFQPTQGVEYHSVMNVYDMSHHVTVDNCAFSCQQYYGSGSLTDPHPNPYLLRVESPSVENHTCDNFTVTNSFFSGGHGAINIQGSGYVAHPRMKNVTVKGNEIRDSYWHSIFCNTVDRLVIEGNTIENRNNCKDDFRGIDIFVADFHIEGNRMVLSNTETSLRGINIRKNGGGSAVNGGMVVNNVIALPDAADDFHHGIDIQAPAHNVTFLHNTVVVSGRAGHPLGITGNPAEISGIEFSANMLQNLSGNAAIHISYPEYIDNTLEKIDWNNNCYYGSSLLYDNGCTLDEYAVKASDATSTFHSVEFPSATNLRPMDDCEEIRVARNDNALTDIEGRERPETTTRGAYQYRPMSTEAPVMAEGYPKVMGATVSSVTVAVKWNVPGDLYSTVRLASDPAPDAETLLNQEYREVAADTETLVTFQNLNENTAFRTYFLMNTVRGGNSAVVASDEVSTHRDYTKLTVTAPAGYTDMAYGDHATLTVDVNGGDDSVPYTYEWFDQMMQPAGSDAAISVSPEVSTVYTVKVTSGDNQTARAKVKVRVTGAPLAVATFDDNYLTRESSWSWDREIIPADGSDSFFSGSFEFGNTDDRAHSAWGGFGYANESSSVYSGMTHMMRNAVGGGALETEAYGVANIYGYGNRSAVTLTNSAEGETVAGLYLTNSAMTLSSIVNGDATNEPFADGDFLEVEITGIDADGNPTGKVVAVLADFRDGRQETVTDWRYFSLEPLGAVKTLDFGCYTSRDPQMQRLFCLDQLGAPNPAGALGLTTGGALTLTMPVADVLAVNGAPEEALLEVFTPAGSCVMSEHIGEGSSAISVASLDAGVYVARVSAAGSSAVLRFVKR